jgi:uncharacterized protein (DUF1778 family)
MAGRRKKPEDEAKTYMLRIRMTADDRRLLEEAAKSKSLETSTWARSELVALARKLLLKKAEKGGKGDIGAEKGAEKGTS